jgi:hypothetical protein
MDSRRLHGKPPGRTVLSLVPLLPLLSLGAAGYILLRLYLRNRQTKHAGPAGAQGENP